MDALAIFFTDPRTVDVRPVRLREGGDGHVLVRTAYSGISAGSAIPQAVRLYESDIAREGDGGMGGHSRWRESGHIERAMETAGGEGQFEAEVQQMQDQARGWRLAEMRRRRGLTQEQVAGQMGISMARVSQIENGAVSTRDVLDRYIAALGGTLRLVADFGDEQLKVS